MFFAYETRHLSIPALNDSKYIGISVYNVLIMCATEAAIAFIDQDKTSVSILITVFMFSCTTITLCLVFLPKIFEVKHDPSGKRNKRLKKFFKTAISKDGYSKNGHSDDLDRKISDLWKKIDLNYQ